MFLPQQVIKKFIIFELITTTPRPKRKRSQHFEGNGKRKKNINPYEKKSKFNTWKKHRSLNPKGSADFVERAPLGCRVSYPFPQLSSQETRGHSYGTWRPAKLSFDQSEREPGRVGVRPWQGETVPGLKEDWKDKQERRDRRETLGREGWMGKVEYFVMGLPGSAEHEIKQNK